MTKDLEWRACCILVTPKLAELLENGGAVSENEFKQYKAYSSELTSWAFGHRDRDFFRTLLETNRNLFGEEYLEVIGLSNEELEYVADRVVMDRELVEERNRGRNVVFYDDVIDS